MTKKKRNTTTDAAVLALIHRMQRMEKIIADAKKDPAVRRATRELQERINSMARRKK